MRECNQKIRRKKGTKPFHSKTFSYKESNKKERVVVKKEREWRGREGLKGGRLSEKVNRNWEWREGRKSGEKVREEKEKRNTKKKGDFVAILEKKRACFFSMKGSEKSSPPLSGKNMNNKNKWRRQRNNKPAKGNAARNADSPIIFQRETSDCTPKKTSHNRDHLFFSNFLGPLFFHFAVGRKNEVWQQQ